MLHWTERTVSLPSRLWVAALAGMAIFATALSVAVLGQLGAVATGMAMLLALVALVWRRDASHRHTLLMLVIGAPLALGLVDKVVGTAWAGPWQVVPLLLSFAGVTALRRACTESRALAGFVAVFLAFLAWALLSSLLGRSRPIAGVYQFASDLKPLLLVMLGFAVLWDVRVDATLRWFTHWLWVPLAALVVFEWAVPDLFFAVFSGHGSARPSIDPTGLLPSRATGMFTHPALLATTAAWFCVLSAAFAGNAGERARRRFQLEAVIYFALVFASVQRQELAALVVALVLMWMLAHSRFDFSRWAVAALGLVLALGSFWLLYAENLLLEFRAWGWDPIRAIEHPRAQIMSGAWHVAAERFPFGSGLGTFGGAGAAKYDSSLYLELGFGSYWWFGREDFLLDTYWPNSLAEAGFAGALLLALSYVLLLVHAIAASMRAPEGTPARAFAKACAALCLYMLALSATSPAFQDPRLFLLPALLTGISWGAARDKAGAARAGSRAGV
jgi:hypothetical protein